MKRNKSFWIPLIVISGLIFLSTCLGCAKKQTSGGMVSESEPRDVPAETNRPKEPAGTPIKPAPGYDLENEMLEDDERVKPEDLEEEIEPLESDTFAVSDVAVEKTEASDYGLGYRVQVFASSELEKAKSIKAKIIADTGYPAYIEFESGLYKVRVGNFRKREAAAQARSDIVEFFPDCWIVQTTIKK